ncbi:sensor histidine kinase [Chryseobacterium sp. JK1]|uniref:sensor histidine kinase n=1 Tax=Chryseobacterium sp. JK1 TaxID=874294 RepID=UPI003D69654A
MKLFIKQNWKKILMIGVLYTCWSMIAFLFLVALQGRTLTLEQFGGKNIFWNFAHSILKGTVVYYLLIFRIIIPSLERKDWKKLGWQTALFFIVLTLYEYIWAFHIDTPIVLDQHHTTVRTFVLSIIMLDVLILLVSIFAAVLMISNEMSQRKAELEKQKLKAELAAVKYQINPHFLFNSLSFIYTKTYRTQPEAAEAVQLLSEIMSYALEDWGELGTVPLMSEVAQMQKVIAMNQIRFNHQLAIQYHEEIGFKEVQVPILVFVTLIENAFKHGDLTDAQNKLNIELKVTESQVHFLLQNKKKKGIKEPSKGIGLSNVKKRLDLMYGSRHSFTIKEDEQFYSNEITINL